MSSKIKSYPTYTIECPIVQVGEFLDSKGEKVTITPDLLGDIYTQINHEVPIVDNHTGVKIGEMKKYFIRGDKIMGSALITDNDRFAWRQRSGFNHVSPELILAKLDDGKISAKLTGTALSNNPGMIPDMYKVNEHHFDAPPNEDSWHAPLGEVNQTIEKLNKTIENFGEKIMTTEVPKTETNKTVTVSVDDLENMISSAVEKRLEAMKPAAPEASETKPAELPKELAEQYAKMVSKMEEIETTQTNALKKTYTDKINLLKSMGEENPEKMFGGADLPYDQRISILDAYMEFSARKAPVADSLQEPITAKQPSDAKNVPTIDTFLSQYGKVVNPNLRNLFEKISVGNKDNLMRFGLLPVLDDSGKFII